MKRNELTVGTDYAANFDYYEGYRVRVLDTSVARMYFPNGRYFRSQVEATQKGVLVQLLNNDGTPRTRRVKGEPTTEIHGFVEVEVPGEDTVVNETNVLRLQDIKCTWEEHVEQQAAVAARKAEREAKLEAASDARLHALQIIDAACGTEIANRYNNSWTGKGGAAEVYGSELEKIAAKLS